jgi:hypothetical protein
LTAWASNVEGSVPTAITNGSTSAGSAGAAVAFGAAVVPGAAVVAAALEDPAAEGTSESEPHPEATIERVKITANFTIDLFLNENTSTPY